MKNLIPRPFRLFSLILVLSTFCQCGDNTNPGTDLQANQDAESQSRLEWFSQAKYGLFLHWGLYAVCEGDWNNNKEQAEWLMIKENFSSSEYEKFADSFNPVKFNAEDWVNIARSAGMKYIVITAKHHDGFCMYNSEYTDYDIVDATPYGKDPMKELAEACRENGIKLCFYYSIVDWHHPEFPVKYSMKKFHPLGYHGDPNPDADVKKYALYMKNQLRELLSNYGDIGIIWFDTGGAFRAEDMAELLDGDAIVRMIREIQPQCLINNRLGVEGTDYGTPEQHIPGTVQAQPFEVCMTLGRKWSWNKYDTLLKSPAQVIYNLVDIVSKGGNYLLGIGPKPDGTLPEIATERMLEVGAWLEQYGESIYNAGKPDVELRFRSGIITQNEEKIFLHFFKAPGKTEIIIEGFVLDFKRAYFFDDPQKREIPTDIYHNTIVLNLPPGLKPDPDKIVVIEYHN